MPGDRASLAGIAAENRPRPRRISVIGILGVVAGLATLHGLLTSRAIVRRGDGRLAEPVKVVGIGAHSEERGDSFLHTGTERGLRLLGGTTIVIKYWDLPSFADAVSAHLSREGSVSELHFYAHVDKFGQTSAAMIRDTAHAEIPTALARLRPLFARGAHVHVHNCDIGGDYGALKALSAALGVPVRAGTGGTYAAGEEGTPLFEVNTGSAVECTATECH